MNLRAVFGLVEPFEPALNEATEHHHADPLTESEPTESDHQEGLEPLRKTIRIGEDTVFLRADFENAEAYGRVVAACHRGNSPVLLDVDAESNEIQELLVPYPDFVESVEPASPADSNLVDFFFGTGILRRSNQRYDDILALLIDSSKSMTRIWIASKVLETESNPAADERFVEIIDARKEPVSSDPAPPPKSVAPVEFDDSQLDSISDRECSKLFTYIKNLNTPDLNASDFDETIPFNFIEHGCEARAHEVCRHILNQYVINRKIYPMKVWLFHGRERLALVSEFHPKCKVFWGFHVAPAVRVNGGIRILDPSLADHAMTFDELKQRFDSSCMHVSLTGPDVYLMTRDRTLFDADPNYKKTKQFLAGLRAGFDLLVTLFKAPPYDHCPRIGSNKSREAISSGP